MINEPLECNTPTYIKTPFGAVRSMNGSTNVTISVSNTRVPSRCVVYVHISIHFLKASLHNLTHVGPRLAPAIGGFWVKECKDNCEVVCLISCITRLIPMKQKYCPTYNHGNQRRSQPGRFFPSQDDWFCVKKVSAQTPGT